MRLIRKNQHQFLRKFFAIHYPWASFIMLFKLYTNVRANPDVKCAKVRHKKSSKLQTPKIDDSESSSTLIIIFLTEQASQ